MTFYFTAIALALALSALGWGIYLSLKVFNIPDITTDGSYTIGAAITAVHLMHGGSWLLAIVFSVLGGFLAGLLTGIIHTRLKVNALLSGILVMTAAYSVNLGIMGKSNIPLIQTQDIFSQLKIVSDQLSNSLLILIALLILIGAFLAFLLKSDFGLAMRATGNAPEMAAALGIPVKTMKILGLALANGLTALSGSIIAQYQGFADINMGIGIVIFGLGAVMIGESIINLFGKNTIFLRLLGVVIGCIVFRAVIAFTLASGLDPNWLKAITASIVLIFVAIPKLGGKSIAND
jgi:putative tryptophan/tyrosine transport system permease protein